MTIQVTGKNIEVGSSLQDYILEKVGHILEKYIGPEISGQIVVSKDKKGRFDTKCLIRLRTGLLLEAKGEASDAYHSVDSAIERLEKRLRRYKRRLKDHHNDNKSMTAQQSRVNDFVVSATDEDLETIDRKAEPLIVAETERMIGVLPVSEAVMQLDLTDEAFLVFRNAANGATNIVYRRDDGNFGWIDPGQSKI